MNDPNSIELAGSWRQNFVNKVSHVNMVQAKGPDGIKRTYMEQVPIDPNSIPVLLLGNKYDLVSSRLVFIT